MKPMVSKVFRTVKCCYHILCCELMVTFLFVVCFLQRELRTEIHEPKSQLLDWTSIGYSGESAPLYPSCRAFPREEKNESGNYVAFASTASRFQQKHTNVTLKMLKFLLMISKSPPPPARP